MLYRNFGNKGFKSSILGLGTMRLPTLDNDNSKIDEDKAIELIRYGIDNGINYLDTAYPYHNGNSEKIVGKALRDRYREKITLVTKSPVWLVKVYEDFEKYLDEQLKRLQTECIDIYLMHALNEDFWQIILEHEGLKFLDEMKKKGKIKHVGFSIHADFSLHEKIIKAYNWDMCMIQMNYIDQDTQVQVKGLKLAGKMGIPVAIMEPLKGGLLVDPPKEIIDLWNQSSKKLSPVEWSFRWLANFPEVKVILSGMSTMNHLKENLEIAQRLTANSLSSDDLKIVDKVRKAYIQRIKVPCTECRYCMPCPHGVNIPVNFRLFNIASIYNSTDSSAYKYNKILTSDKRASACIECGDCLNKCPQGIDIIRELIAVDKTLARKKDFNTTHWIY